MMLQKLTSDIKGDDGSSEIAAETCLIDIMIVQSFNELMAYRRDRSMSSPLLRNLKLVHLVSDHSRLLPQLQAVFSVFLVDLVACPGRNTFSEMTDFSFPSELFLSPTSVSF